MGFKVYGLLTITRYKISLIAFDLCYLWLYLASQNLMICFIVVCYQVLYKCSVMKVLLYIESQFFWIFWLYVFSVK